MTLLQRTFLRAYELVFAALERRGYYLFRKNYYLPIPEPGDLEVLAESALVGVDLDAHRAFSLLETAVAPHRERLATLPLDAPTPEQPFFLLNGRFMAVDAHVYYGLVRHLQPARIVEIGSGFSTLLAAQAIADNVAAGARATDLTSIDPHPIGALTGLGSRVRLLRSPVQAVPMETFTALGAGDVLFIDSSHVLKSGGDVWYEYCEILPRLRPGVWVHVHDVSLPLPYPRVYFDQRLYWNEQYLLQAFLTFNSRVEVVWPGSWLMCREPERMAAAFAPGWERMRRRFPSSWPTSFWFRMK